MKKGWETKRLGDVCQIIGGGTPSKANPKFYNGDILWATVRDMSCDALSTTECRITAEAVKKSSSNVIPKNNVIIATRVGLGKVCLLEKDTAINQDLRGIIPLNPNKLLVRYLFLWLKSIAPTIVKNGVGATVQGVKLPFIKDLQIPLPPFPEQKRIVGVLDEAFAAIANAKENAEKNLQNARELFDSTLQTIFTRRGEGWEETTLGSEISLLTGFPFKSSQYTESEKAVRLLRGDNIIQGALRWDDVKKWPSSDAAGYKSYELAVGDVVLAMDRPWIKSGLKRAAILQVDLPCLLVQRTARLRANRTLDSHFLFYLIGSNAFTRHILGVQTGIGVPHISGQQIKDFRFLRPSLNEQKNLVKKLNELSTETQRLESIYRQKLTAWEELKKSILQKAFSGELTESQNAAISTETISPEELYARCIAYAERKHKDASNDNTFGHVKAEKIVHLIGEIAGLDFGRTPYKDAAGPNDSDQRSRAEALAKRQEYFEFVPRKGKTTELAYNLRRLKNFDHAADMFGATLGKQKNLVDKILDILVPRNTQDVEVLATVHAAWNNLLIKGKKPDNKAIIREARDEWHEDKLKIPEDKFVWAIDCLKKHKLEPQGKGKAITHKQGRFI